MKNLKNTTKHKSLKLILFSLLFILLSIILFFFFYERVANSIALNTKTPKDYYAYIMKKNSMKKTKDFMNILGVLSSNKNSNENLSQTTNMYSIDFNMIDDFYTKLLTLDETSLLRKLRNAKIEIMNQSSDKYFMLVSRLKNNDTDLLTLMAIYNRVNNNLYFKIPELSDATFAPIEPSDNTSSSNALQADNKNGNKNPLTKSRVSRLLTRYTTFFIDQVNSVRLQKKVKIKVDNITMTTTKITYSLTFNDLLHAFNNLVDKISYDKDIENIIVSTGICDSSGYRGFLGLSMIALNMYLHDKDLDGTLDFTLWVDDKGNIVGKNTILSYNSIKVTLHDLVLQKGTHVAYDSYVEYTNNKDRNDLTNFNLSIFGDGKLDNFNFDGCLNTKISYNHKNISKDYQGNLDYKVSKVLQKKNGSVKVNGYIYQKENPDTKYHINFSYNKSNGAALIDLTQNRIKYLTAKINTKKDSKDVLTKPIDTSITYSGADGFLPFINSFKLEYLFDNIKEKLKE